MEGRTVIIRKAVESDSDQLWVLMKKLAEFEKYIDSFAITPAIVRESGFRKTPPDFYCLVAVDTNSKTDTRTGINTEPVPAIDAAAVIDSKPYGDKICGMLVYYFHPYTAQNQPNIYMKELFVDEASRGMRIGEQLMAALVEEARFKKCGVIKWGVAPWNAGGIRFYERLGGKENNDWLNFELRVES